MFNSSFPGLFVPNPSPAPVLSVRDITNLFKGNGDCRYQALLSSELLSSFAGKKRLFVCFDRVGCRADLTVSFGKETLSFSHYGSFTKWCAEIPAFRSREMTLDLTLKEDTKTVTPYGIAGILGSICLIGSSEVLFSDISLRPVREDGKWNTEISCLVDAGGSPLPEALTLQIDSANGTFSFYVTDCGLTCSIPAADQTLPWSPEHPVLYPITLSLYQGNELLDCRHFSIGYRTIRRQGSRILWNQKPLLLKGLAYREPLPCEGFSAEHDLKLFKEAGVNYLRSLCYPFSEAFLSLCDRYGILAEQGTAADGVGISLPANENAPALRPLFVGQFEEMVLAGRSHVSILLWSLGNECVWGDNFRQELALLRVLDPDRLKNFHYPMTIPSQEWIPDVWSMQYGSWNLPADVCYDQMIIFHTHGSDNPAGYEVGKAQDYHLPVLHDAFAPVPVYDLDSLEREDGIHEFWGESFSRFWDNISSHEGALGGAVMAAFDEDGRFFPSLLGYRRGILDENHEPKPEYWHVKSVYLEDPFAKTEEDESEIYSNSRFTVRISKKTGLISGIFSQGKEIVSAGPFLEMGRFRLEPWSMTSCSVKPVSKGICLESAGTYGPACSAVFTLFFSETGELKTDCKITHLGRPMPHQVKSGIGLDPGGLYDYGIRYLLPPSADRLSWHRDAFGCRYPENHIGRAVGTVGKENRSDFTSLKANLLEASVSGNGSRIRVIPESYLRPAHTSALRNLTDGTDPANDEAMITEHSSLRLELTPNPACVLDDREESCPLASVSWEGNWYRVDDPAGLANDTETMSREKDASCTVHFEGSGITVYGSTDRIRGLCDVILDGKTVKTGISEHTPAVQFPAMCRGYEKRHHVVLFSCSGLKDEEHVLTIRVTGEKEAASQNAYISIDSFTVTNPRYPESVSINLLADYNYPRLTQGNYMRPAVMAKEGDLLSCRLYLEETEENL